MEHPVEFIGALMTASVVFMTIAGVVFGFSTTQKSLGRWHSTFLLLSLAFGALVVTLSLAWYNDSSESTKLFAIIALLIQFFIMWVPFVRLIQLVGRQ